MDGSFGIGHTRWATHGRPTEENAHPHRDCNGDMVVVHNGIIENYLDLKHRLQAEGHIFTTETDTEVIAHLVEKLLQRQSGRSRAEGRQRTDAAFRAGGASRARIRKKIVAARDGPPVVVGSATTNISWRRTCRPSSATPGTCFSWPMAIWRC